MIHLLRKNLCSLLTDLYSRFVLPRASTGISIEKVQYTEVAKQKLDADLLIGTEARKMIQDASQYTLRQKRIEEFYSSVRQYFQTVVKYLLKNLPLDDPVLTAAVVVDVNSQMDVSLTQLEVFLDRFPVLIPSGFTKDNILEEFAAYQVTDLSDFMATVKKENMRADKVWCLLEGGTHPQFSGLSSVMRGILTIPHSSANCKRIFSMVRKISTDQRSSLHKDTTEALLVLKSKPDLFDFTEKTLKGIKSAYYRSLHNTK